MYQVKRLSSISFTQTESMYKLKWSDSPPVPFALVPASASAPAPVSASALPTSL